MQGGQTTRSKLPKRAGATAVAALVSIAIASAAPALAQATEQRVRIESGVIQGTASGDVASFKGIPYAAPLVGDRRWRPPQPGAPWTGVRPATEYGPDCMQKPIPGDAAASGSAFGEDCLFVNVWRPAATEPGATLPVLVWIHGGGFLNGGSSAPVFDGSTLARHGLIVVSLNYRLGRLGFFIHPALAAHRSFVLNKLGVESVILFHRGSAIRLNALTAGTQDYFMRLPGHDTLRLILAKLILVEGPSDELIVQAAFKKQHGKMPLEAGVDVISVNSLAFKRFLEIAVILDRTVAVVTDDDGKVATLTVKYADYAGKPKISILYDADETFPTLEPQLLKANGRAPIEKILGKTFASDAELLAFMKGNKADPALKFFTTAEPWKVPGYIVSAVS